AGGRHSATLTAAYGLGHRLGVRYLLREDLYPDLPDSIKLDGFDVSADPVLRTRAWTTLDASPLGLASWPVGDQKRLVAQLAKLNFNRLVIAMRPWQPTVEYKIGKVQKTTAMLWRGPQFP